MTISDRTIRDLHWWKENIPSSFCSIKQYNFVIEIFTDASLSGWGASCCDEKIHGFWSAEERKHSINYLELLAVFLALKAFVKSFRDCEILLRIDNTTAISYVNKLGGSRYVKYLDLASLIWKWAGERRIWLFASYIPSSENIEADFQSRITNIDTEWELAGYAYKQIKNTFGYPSIDLFSTKINSKTKVYCSWYRDPNAIAIDAFTLTWNNLIFYAFPPFSMIGKVLQKIVNEKATVIVIVPYWTTQPWFPVFINLLVREPIIFKANKKLLLSRCRTLVHALAGLLSGERSNEKE